jgi:hypothetical protein
VQYLTRNYTAYINAKKQAELVRPANTPTTNVIEIQRPNLPLLVPNLNNETKNNANKSFAIINTRFEGLSQVKGNYYKLIEIVEVVEYCIG